MVVHTTRPWLRRLDLTYTPPQNRVTRFFWAQRMRFECSYALSMLEPWEKILVLGLLFALWYSVVTGAVKYLPHHIDFLRQRAAYYLEGVGSDEL
ncbi:hypothetical protein AURDEDRAFT_72932 [Auricularia subglabra TFB-10046 SS5]|uniref:Uncharacterized protein n=1 Tax=Auricularia subglabra (strain TFB-10046 / SS5) TaxID=717982 RepID=J0WWE3_AURST|nr:hypothetical protein AURDEDRAFT_72932 [Auricularia subglabra TFB-10046 SS5]